MRVLFSAMGRAVVLAALPVFLIFMQGVWVAPDLNEAANLAASSSILILIAGIRALFVFVPKLSEALTKFLRIPVTYEHVVIMVFTAAIGGFLSVAINFLSAPDMNAAKAAALAGMLAIGSAITSIVMGTFTPGLGPVPEKGFNPPPQPVPAAALPTPKKPG